MPFSTYVSATSDWYLTQLRWTAGEYASALLSGAALPDLSVAFSAQFPGADPAPIADVRAELLGPADAGAVTGYPNWVPMPPLTEAERWAAARECMAVLGIGTVAGIVVWLEDGPQAGR